MSRVAKKAAKDMNLRTYLNRKGNSVEDRKRLKELREFRYSTDAAPSAGAAWQPNPKNMARGSTGRAKKLQSGYDARQRQGMNLGR